MISKNVGDTLSRPRKGTLNHTARRSLSHTARRSLSHTARRSLSTQRHVRLVSGMWAVELVRAWKGVGRDRSLGDSSRETSCVVLHETGRAILVQPFNCVYVCVLRRL